MRIGLKVVAFLGVSSLASPASAQRFGERFGERCEREKAEIDAMKSQVSSIDAELPGIADKIEKIRRRLQEFETRRADKLRERGELIQGIERREAEMNHRCGSSRECEALDQRIDELKRHQDPLADIMRALENEIRERSREVGRLNVEVDRIENSYQQQNCDNLVPGQTAQAAIDRCTELFSAWNRLQADINRVQDSVKGLRQRYTQAYDRIGAIGAEIARLLEKMRESCRQSSRLGELEALEQRGRQFNSLQVDLDDMDKKVQRYRSIRIMQPRLLPTIRPKEDNKPSIRPH